MGSRPIDPAILAEEALPTPQARAIGHAPLINYATKNVQPPSIVYVTVNDRLVVSAAAFGIQPVQQIEIRYLLPDGTIQVQEEFITPGNNRTLVTKTYQLTEGFLLSVSIAPAAGITGRALCFVTCGLQRGSGSLAPNVYMLGTGYTSVTAPLIWPGGRYEFPQSPPGWIQTDTVVNPGAGLDWTFTVPANDRVKPMGITAVLNTSAAVATRQVMLVIDSGAFNISWSPAPLGQTASQSLQYSFGPGAPNASLALNVIQTGIPVGIMLAAGARIRTVTAAMQTADQWTAIAVHNEHLMDL